MPDYLPSTPALEGRTLLDELNHRIKNELASVINLVTFKAVRTDNVDAKEELSNVVDLLHQHVQVHSILTMPDHDAVVDAGGASKAGTGNEPVQAGAHEHPPRVGG
jgi:two-component sensor histidine kinase